MILLLHKPNYLALTGLCNVSGTDQLKPAADAHNKYRRTDSHEILQLSAILHYLIRNCILTVEPL